MASCRLRWSPTRGNKPRRWAEIEPYVWKDLDSGEKLAAKVEDGQVTRWSFDTVSPFMVFDRAPWYKDAGLVAPTFYAALWLAAVRGACMAGGGDRPAPVQGCATSTAGKRLRLQRIWHGWQWLALATFAGWVTFVSVGSRACRLLGGPLDPLLFTLQVLTADRVHRFAGALAGVERAAKPSL